MAYEDIVEIATDRKYCLGLWLQYLCFASAPPDLNRQYNNLSRSVPAALNLTCIIAPDRVYIVLSGIEVNIEVCCN